MFAFCPSHCYLHSEYSSLNGTFKSIVHESQGFLIKTLLKLKTETNLWLKFFSKNNI